MTNSIITPSPYYVVGDILNSITNSEHNSRVVTPSKPMITKLCARSQIQIDPERTSGICNPIDCYRCRNPGIYCSKLFRPWSSPHKLLDSMVVTSSGNPWRRASYSNVHFSQADLEAISLSSSELERMLSVPGLCSEVSSHGR
jgi:hypothetical protein